MALTGPGSGAITGKDDGGSHLVEAAKATASQMKKGYESREFQLGAGTIDESYKNGNAVGPVPIDGMKNIANGHIVIVRTDVDIELKFNLNTNDKITVTGTEAVFTFRSLEFQDFFISVPGGAPANLKIIVL